MNGHPFMQLPHITPPVRKYQDRWQFCLDRKTHSYYWPGRCAQQRLEGQSTAPVPVKSLSGEPFEGFKL
jgi:hypothetical protein